MAGKKGRSGAPRHNVNGLKTGTAVSHARLTVGELPKELLSVRREGRTYRRVLEQAVLDAKKSISVTDCHLIDTASAATIAAGISRWCLRHKIKEMKANDVLACGQAILRAKQTRDAAVKALDLDRPPPDPWETVHALPAPANEGSDNAEAHS